jgi:Histidine kinase/Histidine kinase-, DNA gyrase B-, and HSP90-like ATPase
MNTTAIALSARRRIHFDRIRGMYNGWSYIVVVSLLLDLWWTTEVALPKLLDGHVQDFAWTFLYLVGRNLQAMIAGLALVPVIVNLAPRAGLLRFTWLLALTALMGWWCLWIEGVHWGLNWPSLGNALDGLLTPGLVVGVCAYHSDTREAADELLRAQIARTSLDAELMQAQLQLLRAQVEPHFLFNTLSVVHALSSRDRAATTLMLDHLRRYFEAALPRLRGNEVPLWEEVELVEAYLAIYRVRLGARLTYEIDMPERLRQLRVPSMMLLTLVENALKHGVCPTVEGGRIRVSAGRERDRLVLSVGDSGRGLDLRLGRGIGLANIRQRLVMMYGRDALLTLRPANPHGVVASICVPAH